MVGSPGRHSSGQRPWLLHGHCKLHLDLRDRAGDTESAGMLQPSEVLRASETGPRQAEEKTSHETPVCSGFTACPPMGVSTTGGTSSFCDGADVAPQPVGAAASSPVPASPPSGQGWLLAPCSGAWPFIPSRVTATVIPASPAPCWKRSLM